MFHVVELEAQRNGVESLIFCAPRDVGDNIPILRFFKAAYR